MQLEPFIVKETKRDHLDKNISIHLKLIQKCKSPQALFLLKDHQSKVLTVYLLMRQYGTKSMVGFVNNKK